MTARGHLTQTELMVMLAILRLGAGAYGVPIAREIQDCTGRELPAGAVYAALERLEDRSLVASKLGEATSMRGGRAKTYFRLTSKGLRQVRETQHALRRLWGGIPQLAENFQ